jgi:hypothetical protein
MLSMRFFIQLILRSFTAGVVCANANFFAEKSFSKWRSALAEVFPKYPVSSAAGIGKTNHFGFIPNKSRFFILVSNENNRLFSESNQG